jgi:phosphatidate cytidylyltransferase
MKTRVITGIGIFVVAVLLVVLAPFTPIFCIGMSVLAVMASFELLRVFGIHKDWHISAPSYLLAAALPFAAYFVTDETRVKFILIEAAIIFIYLVYLLGAAVFSHKKIKFVLVAAVFMALVYVIVSFTSLSLLMYVNKGLFYFGVIIISSWGCDAGAYFIGCKFGKHKLIPDVSPNKSVEGAIGGVLVSIVLNVLYGFVVSSLGGAKVEYLSLALLGLVLSIVAMVGDLIASLIKREYGIKDYSNLLPGHGGIVDRFDSVFPIATFLLMMSAVWAPFA